MFGLFSSDKEAKFWKWFVANEERLYSELVNDGPNVQAAVDAVFARLRKVNKGLACEFLLEPPKKTLFLSPAGIRDLIPVVESLHAKAPTLARWEIVKFKHRKPSEDFKVRFADRELTSDKVRYRLIPEKDRIGVELLFADYDARFLSVYQQVGFIMLDSMLGEYDVMTKVGSIDFKPLQGGDGTLPPISNLAEDFDTTYGQLAK